MEAGVAGGRRVNSHEYEEGAIPGVLQSRCLLSVATRPDRAQSQKGALNEVQGQRMALFVGEIIIY